MAQQKSELKYSMRTVQQILINLLFLLSTAKKPYLIVHKSNDGSNETGTVGIKIQNIQ